MTEPVFQPMAYLFNPWAVPPVLVALCLVSSAVRALVRPKRALAVALGAAWGMCAAVWLTSVALTLSARDNGVALVWAKLGLTAGIFLLPLALNFADAFLGQRSGSGLLGAIVWAVAVLFASATAFTDTLVSGVRLCSWGFYPQFGPLGSAFMAWALGIMAWVTAQHARLAWRSDTSRADRARRRAFCIGVLVGNLGAVDLLGAVGWPIYPLGWLPVTPAAWPWA
jgi:hypothetical protein